VLKRASKYAIIALRVETLPMSCGNRMFIAMFTKARTWCLSWSRYYSTHDLIFIYFKMLSNIILPSRSRNFICF
jgi:hypothetical protein